MEGKVEETHRAGVRESIDLSPEESAVLSTLEQAFARENATVVEAENLVRQVRTQYERAVGARDGLKRAFDEELIRILSQRSAPPGTEVVEFKPEERRIVVMITGSNQGVGVGTSSRVPPRGGGDVDK